MKAKNIINRIKIGAIIALVLAAVVLSGCVSRDSTKSAINNPQIEAVSTPSPTAASAVAVPTVNSKTIVTSSPTTKAAPSSNTGTNVPPDSIIQQADVPTLTFSEFNYVSTPKDKEFKYTGLNSGRASKTRAEIVDAYREVGQSSRWVSLDQSSLSFQLSVFDTNAGNGADLPAKVNFCPDQIKSGSFTDCGSANIGDLSYYYTAPWSGMEFTTLSVAKGKYFVFIGVEGKAGTSKDEAIRIANLVLGRLK
jgi:hypothetical protein